MTIPIKCIFQGGGAKLVTLLAAAEVLEDLEGEGILQVTEVAGTSAGSIAAYLLAHQKPTDQLRLKMKIAARDVISHFSKRPSMKKLAWKIYWGSPVFDEKKLREFIRAIVTEDEAERPKLSDTRIPVHICTADIRNGTDFIYPPESNAPIDRVLADSCAIPIAFRTFSDNSDYADGGVASNLVGPSVFGETTERVLALSFARTAPRDYKDAQSYLLALASTAIDSSVEQSQNNIIAQGGYVCELPNEYGTFDFHEALENGLDDKTFRESKSEIRAKILRAIDGFRRADRQLDLKNDLGRVQRFANATLSRIMEQYPYAIVGSSTLCVANCLGSKNDDEAVQPDKVIKDVYVSASGDELMAFRIGLTREEHYELGKDINWEIHDAQGVDLKKEVIHEVLETVQRGDQSVVYQSCFCFAKPIVQSRTPVRIRLVTSHVKLMGNLRFKEKTEYMRSESHQEDRVKSLDFVFCYPQQAGEFVMTDLLQNYHRADPKPSKFAEMKERWFTGGPLTGDGLTRYRNEHLYLSDYQFSGWRWENVPPETFSGVLIERSR